MVEKNETERDFVENNPAVHPTVRDWATAIDNKLTWTTTTTTTTTTT